MPFSSLIAPIAGAAIGGLLGGDGGGSQQTASKEPWAPTQDWLKNIIAQGQGLQGYYQKNPFNSVQTNAYANILNDSDAYRETLLPSLMGLANNLTSGANFYDRRDPFKKPAAFTMPTNFTPATTQANGNTNFLNGLYQANFGRAPDASGMAYWQGLLSNGTSRDAVANEFRNIKNGTPNATTTAPLPGGGLLGAASQSVQNAINSANPYQNGVSGTAAPAPAAMAGAPMVNGMTPIRFGNGYYYDTVNGTSW